MKNMMIACFFASLMALSCSKSEEPAGVAASYMTISANSSWNYQLTDNITPANSTSYVVTSTTRDSAVNGKSYHVYTNSSGPNEYYNITGNDYYTYQTLPAALGGSKVEALYLKAASAVDVTWSEPLPMDIPGVGTITLSINYKIKEKGIDKIVNGQTYTNVINVETTITAPAPFTSALTTNIHRYYAPIYGLIQNETKIDLVYPALGIDQHVDTQTKLLTATIF